MVELSIGLLQLEEKRQYLEHHWVLAGKELDQEKMLRQKIEKEQESGFERALKSEKEKCDTLRRNHEKQLETMKAGHAKQCDELGRAILKATLEADRLHNQLIGSPRSTKMFSNRNSWRDVTIVVLLFSGIVAVSKQIVLVHADFPFNKSDLVHCPHSFCRFLPFLHSM